MATQKKAVLLLSFGTVIAGAYALCAFIGWLVHLALAALGLVPTGWLDEAGLAPLGLLAVVLAAAAVFVRELRLSPAVELPGVHDTMGY